MNILRVFFILFYPFSYTINIIVKFLIVLFGGKLEHDGPKITEDELEFLISIGEKEGVLENQKKEMLHNIFEISETYVKEVMVPLNDVTMIEINTPLNEIINIITKQNILGYQYMKTIWIT